MRERKPIPKTQAELQPQITPFLANQGSPVSNFDRNRGTDVSMKGDTVKDISIGLEDIDSAVMYYFNNVIKPTVIQDGNRVAVRTIYASPERWKSVQQDGFYRDGNNQILVPIIVLKRENIEKNRTLTNKLDGNRVHNYQVTRTKYNKKNAYDKFDIINNRQPSEQYYITSVPDYLTITYSCVIWTNFVEQNNKIVEAVEFASDSYWGDPNRFKFRSRIDSYSTTMTVENNTDRAAKTTFNIVLNGYIIPDTINKDLATARSKYYTKSQVIFDMETIDTNGVVTKIDELSFANKPQKNTANSTSFIGGGNNLSINISSELNSVDLAYLNANVTKVANTVTNDTATFNASSILQPSAGSSLPATSLSNFAFYANSLPISANEIISFASDGNGNLVLTINPSLLGYYLTGKTITAVGKFQ
jgi:hypothetical protein